MGWWPGRWLIKRQQDERSIAVSTMGDLTKNTEVTCKHFLTVNFVSQSSRSVCMLYTWNDILPESLSSKVKTFTLLVCVRAGSEWIPLLSACQTHPKPLPDKGAFPLTFSEMPCTTTSKSYSKSAPSASCSKKPFFPPPPSKGTTRVTNQRAIQTF